jgi:hypothetical protein
MRASGVRGSLEPVMQDIRLILVTVAVFAVMFALLRGFDRV